MPPPSKEEDIIRRVKEGRSPSFYNQFPFPLIRGRGTKGDRVT